MSNHAALDEARAALATNETELAALEVAKSQASRNPALFNEWRTKYAVATVERERLVALVGVLERQVEDAEEAEASLRKRHAAKLAANAKLASRIRSDVAKANAIMLGACPRCC